MTDKSISLNSLTWRKNILPSDVNNVYDIAVATGVFIPEELEMTAQLIKDTLENDGNPLDSYRFLFAEHNGRLIGYTCYDRIPLTDFSYDLYWIMLHPDAQGMGIAAELLKRTFANIRALGGKSVYIETSSLPAFEPARKSYLRAGFYECAVFKDFYRDGDDRHMYRYDIK